jgi:hypothetical protein
MSLSLPLRALPFQFLAAFSEQSQLQIPVCAGVVFLLVSAEAALEQRCYDRLVLALLLSVVEEEVVEDVSAMIECCLPILLVGPVPCPLFEPRHHEQWLAILKWTCALVQVAAALVFSAVPKQRSIVAVAEEVSHLVEEVSHLTEEDVFETAAMTTVVEAAADRTGQLDAQLLYLASFLRVAPCLGYYVLQYLCCSLACHCPTLRPVSSSCRLFHCVSIWLVPAHS